MFRKIKIAAPVACIIILGSAVLLGQSPKPQDVSGAGSSLPVGAVIDADACAQCELPIIMHQTVEAGKTAVGTKVEAQLMMGTMTKAGVLPKGALISGEVTESAAL